MTESISRYTRFLYWVVYQLGSIQAFILVVLVQEPIWRSADGRIRRLRDLSNSHLRNAARYVMQSDIPDPVAYIHLTTEQRRRDNERYAKYDKYPTDKEIE